MAADEARREVGTGLLHFPQDRCLHRSDVGHDGCSRIERLDHQVGDAADRRGDDHDLRPAHRGLQAVGGVRDRTHGHRGRGLVPIRVERTHLGAGAGQCESDRPADQAGAYERDVTDHYSGRSSRRDFAPSR